MSAGGCGGGTAGGNGAGKYGGTGGSQSTGGVERQRKLEKQELEAELNLNQVYNTIQNNSVLLKTL
ncbi:MAG: hypothetical protein LBS34_02165 [Rickettsiales bacterium]|nr:hypothetical protein [Rickettsiales bacterium]